MKRILQVIYGLHKNGTETAVMNIYRSLDRDKYQFDFLIFDPKDPGYEEEIRQLGGNIFYLPKFRMFSLHYLHAIRRFFREHAKDYDAVHFNMNNLTRWLPFTLSKKYGIPVRLLHSHNTSLLRSPFDYRLHLVLRRIMRRITNAHVGCSREACRWMFGPDCSDSKVIVNGILTERYLFNPDARREHRKESGLNDSQILIGQVGFFEPVKNHLFSVEIARALRRRLPDAKFIFIGEGGHDEQAMLDKIKEYGLDDMIILPGRRNDVGRLLSAIDIMIMPSVHEGLPLALVEAQTAGLKVLASDRISRDTKCTDNIDFLPIDQGPEPWVERILQVKDYDRQCLREHFAHSPFNMANTAKAFTDIYDGKSLQD